MEFAVHMAKRETESMGELERELQAIARRLQVGKRPTGRSNSEIKAGRQGNGPPKQVSVALKPLTRNPSSTHRHYTKVSDTPEVRPSIKDRIRAVLNAPITPIVAATAVDIPQKGTPSYTFAQVPHHTPHLSQGNPPLPQKPANRPKALTPFKLQIAFTSGCDWSRLRPAAGNL